MTIEVRYLDNRRGAIMVCSGRLKGSEFISASREIFARDSVAEPLLYILMDGDEASSVDVTADDIRDIAEIDVEASRTLPNVLVAVFAQDALAFGLARIWQAYVSESGWTAAIFRNRASAVAWLKREVAKRSGTAITLK